MSRLYIDSVVVSARRCAGRRILASHVPLCIRAGHLIYGGVSASEFYLGVAGGLRSVYIADLTDIGNVRRVYLDEDTPLECEVRVGKSGRTVYRQEVYYDAELGQLYTDGTGRRGATAHGRGAFFMRLCFGSD